MLDALGQMIAERRVPVTDAPRVDDPTELRHWIADTFIGWSFHVWIGGTSMRMPLYNEANRLEKILPQTLTYT